MKLELGEPVSRVYYAISTLFSVDNYPFTRTSLEELWDHMSERVYCRYFSRVDILDLSNEESPFWSAEQSIFGSLYSILEEQIQVEILVVR